MTEVPFICSHTMWYYMADGSIIVEETGEPMKIIESQEDGYIRFRLEREGPAMSDPPIRLMTNEENRKWISGWL
jgi:hypothetical protein